MTNIMGPTDLVTLAEVATDTYTLTRQTEGVASPLLAVGDIALLAGVKLETARKWTQRASMGFPRPVARTSAGAIYLRSDVEAWLRATGRLNSSFSG